MIGSFGSPRRKAPAGLRRMVQIGTGDGSNKIFRLPELMHTNRITILAKTSAGVVSRPAYSHGLLVSSLPSIVAGNTPDTSLNSAYGFGATAPVSLTDGSLTSWWSSGLTAATPIVTFTLTGPSRIVGHSLAWNTSGGFGGLLNYRIEWSHDNSVWKTVGIFTPKTGLERTLDLKVLETPITMSYWKLTGITKQSSLEWGIAEIQIYTSISYPKTITIDTAPASGTTIWALHRTTL